MVHVALIGAGGHSSLFHQPALARVARERPDQVALVAVCDRRPERAEAARVRYGFQHACGEVSELFARWRIDAVVAVVPVPAIVELTLELLPRGIPLLIEKPLGVGLEQTRTLAAAVRAAGARVQVSLNRRFDPGVRRAMARVRETGPLRFVRGFMLRPNRREPEFIWSTGIHLIDLLRHAAGPLTLGEGQARRIGMPAAPGVTAALTGAGGLPVTLDLIPCAGRRLEGLQLIGEGFQADVHTGTGHPWRVEWTRVGSACQVVESSPGDEPEFVGNGAYHEAAEFLDAVAAGRPLPAPSPDDVLPGAELADRLQAVARGQGGA